MGVSCDMSSTLNLTEVVVRVYQYEFIAGHCEPSLLYKPIVGHTATHTVVMARLIIREQDHGIHPFIVQVRSLDDHCPLPGKHKLSGPIFHVVV